MKRTTPLRSDPDVRRAFSDRSRRRGVSPASIEQREAIYGRACVVCGSVPCDPAHLIPRSLCADGANDRRATVPVCREHHREYDNGRLDLLPFLEPHFRDELAFAVERFGLISTLERVTNVRWEVGE